MSMDPPKVLLEHSFLDAVANPQHTHHQQCVQTYRELLDQFEHQQVLLVAVGDHLRSHDLPTSPSNTDRVAWFLHRRHRGVFAPVEALHVGFQHRRAAKAAHASNTVDPVVALTLVMCNRHKVRRMATVNATYAAFDLEVLPPAAE